MTNKNRKVDTIARYSPLEIPKIIRAHWNAEPKVPANFIAEPSTVKSEGALQTAKELSKESGREFFNWNRRKMADKRIAIDAPEKYFIFADLRASETDIGELRLQEMHTEDDFITFKYNILFKVLSQDDAKGILFFDEMNLAPNMIKAQFYKIINDRAVGDIPIADGVLCLSAGNESEHARGVTDDPVPLVLRRGNYFLRPLLPEEYTDYAAKTGHHKHILGYLGFRETDVHRIQYNLPDSVGQPCPRTWTKLSSILKANPNLSIDDVRMVATGLIGQATANTFTAFVKSAKKVDVDAIIKKPSLIREYESQEDNISLVWAIIGEIVARFSDGKDVAKAAAQISLEFEKPEFGTYLLRSMKAVDKNKFSKKFGSLDEMDAVVDRYAKFMFD